MKKYLFLIFISFFLLIFPCSVYAKDYSIKSADITVQIQSDGSADVTETRTYDFDGSYSWADEWINLTTKCKTDPSRPSFKSVECNNYRITDVRLSENGLEYAPYRTRTINGTDGTNGTYETNVTY